MSISGIFSGTLSWLFLQFDGSVPFTELVDQAWQQGLTEPDPRDDLSGKDVMRKLVILAREAGYNIEPDQVRVESLVPAHCEGGSIDHFFENGDELNEQMVQRLEAAREMGLVLRYVARFDAPRDDLSGKDVMRKLVILAREAGYNIEPDQVRVESLVPAHCEGGSIDHFFENGDELNEQMVQRLEAAREMGLVLRYVARFDANGKARVGVEAVREDHPLASLLPCDNVFAIESRWYRDNPLVIRGPGAGRDVTAGAIQSDINRLAQLL